MAGEKILIVDDERAIADLLKLHLEEEGYVILTAQSVDKALKLLEQGPVDLVMLDIGLPKLDGNTLCELIKTDETLKHIKVIMLTGKRLVGDMETAFSAGADLYMNKPYEWQRLLAHIQKLIG